MIQEDNNINKNLSIKYIIRLIALILIVIFFIPTFMVSCSGHSVEISAKTVMSGYNLQGENIIDSHFICILFLLIPVGILLIWSIKGKLTIKFTALITIISAIIDFIMWIILRSSIKKAALENSCSFKSTWWFWFNLILLLCLIILTISIYLNYIQAETKVSDLIHTNNSSISKTLSNNADKKIYGYCENCGNPLTKDNLYCTKCGNKIE